MVEGLLVEVHDVFLKRFHAALIAPGRRIGQGPVAAEHRDLAVTAADQIIHRAGCALTVVRRDAGEIFKRQLARVVGHDNGGHVDLFKVAAEVAVRAAQEHHAHGLALTAELDGAQHLVFILIDEIHDQRMRRAGKQGLQLLDHARKHLVRRALDDDEHRIGALLLEQLRAFVELKSAFFGNGKDRGARLVGNVRLVVEHARNGPERIAAQSCQIFDRHSCLLPLG